MKENKLNIYLKGISNENKIRNLNKIYNNIDTKLINKNQYITNIIKKKFNKIKSYNNDYSFNNYNYSEHCIKYKRKDYFTTLDNVKKLINQDENLDLFDKRDFKFKGKNNLLGSHKNNGLDYRNRLKKLKADSEDSDDECQYGFENDDEVENNKQGNVLNDYDENNILDIIEDDKENQKEEESAKRVQRFYRNSQSMKCSIYKERIFTGWDENKQNLISIFADKFMESNQVVSVSVRIYSIKTKKSTLQTLNIEEILHNHQNATQHFLFSIQGAVRKILQHFRLKLPNEEENSNEKINEDQIDEENEYQFDKQDEQFSIHENEYKSMSSIQEIDYSNI